FGNWKPLCAPSIHLGSLSAASGTGSANDSARLLEFGLNFSLERLAECGHLCDLGLDLVVALGDPLNESRLGLIGKLRSLDNASSLDSGLAVLCCVKLLGCRCLRKRRLYQGRKGLDGLGQFSELL